MDKILSTRVDERIAALVGNLAWKLKKTRKRVIEEAVIAYSERMGADLDVFGETCGAWKRDDDAGTAVAEAREAFRTSLEDRHAHLR